MNAALHWALVDNEGNLVALVRSEHFVPLPDTCGITRQALNLKPFCFLTDKREFNMAEWYTWLAFGIPAIQIVLESANPTAPLEVVWGWQGIDPEAGA